MAAGFDEFFRYRQRVDKTAADGLYVEGANVFINLDTFALSCADGSFHPVAIPRDFLKPAFRARLN